ncbi:MAG: pirin family protein [Rikenellaceae bacterium]|nr:pirin family protein [Rikenellaceae bacterium]
MKIVTDRSDTRGFARHGWLKTYHTFSFAEYYNPKRMHFGALRVLNDDTVLPGYGFDTHPHKNMEVVSIPLKGRLRHGDSRKNSEVISRGWIQVMSTGSGIFHSEYNDSSTEILEFLQIWVIPKIKETEPVYKNYNVSDKINGSGISLFISPDGSISLLQEAWFSWGKLEEDSFTEYNFHGRGTGVYVFVIEGRIRVGNEELGRRDGAGITETSLIIINAMEKSEVLFMEVSL